MLYDSYTIYNIHRSDPACFDLFLLFLILSIHTLYVQRYLLTKMNIPSASVQKAFAGQRTRLKLCAVDHIP